jgi:hypothetical protein
MTPTLVGRWQTRLFILGTVGLVITLLFGLVTGNVIMPLLVLALVIALGWVWDVAYILLQSLRWDQDWPPLFVILSGVWEALAVSVAMRLIPGFPLPAAEAFAVHYGLVWLASYAMLFGGMRILFPRWRFHGGRVW